MVKGIIVSLPRSTFKTLRELYQELREKNKNNPAAIAVIEEELRALKLRSMID